MADPTSYVDVKPESELLRNRMSALIKTSEALVKGGMAAISTATGEMEFMDDAANLVPAGYVKGAVQADGTLTGDGSAEAYSQAGEVVYLSVTGASAISDFGSLVYATDGGTFTLTAPSVGSPIGVVKKWDTGTYCYVTLFELTESVLLGLMPSAGSTSTIRLTTISTTLLEGTAAADLYKFTATSKMQITAFRAYTTGIDSGSVAGDQNLNLEIGSTNLTGGVLNLVYTANDAIADVGTAINASAITGNNIANQGDVITVELAASGTGFTAAKQGQFALEIDVTYLAGA